MLNTMLGISNSLVFPKVDFTIYPQMFMPPKKKNQLNLNNQSRENKNNLNT